MTHFTKSFLKYYLIWGVLFGAATVYILGKVVEDQTDKMAASYTLKPFYIMLFSVSLAGAVLNVLVSWLAIARVKSVGCLDYPENFGVWLRNYAIFMIVFALICTGANIISYNDSIDKLRSLVLFRKDHYNEIMTSRFVDEIDTFKKNFLLIDLGTLAAAVVITFAGLPLLKKKYEQ